MGLLAEHWSLVSALLSVTPNPATLQRFDVPVHATAIDVADGFATHSCAYWAKRCWSSFSPPSSMASEGAPSLACGIEVTGGVTCWSLVERGLFAEPVAVTSVPGLDGAAEIAVGRSEVCIVRRDGALACVDYAWEPLARDWVFAPIEQRAGRWKSVVAGGSRMCAVTSQGEGRCWVAWGDCANDAEDTKPRPVKLRCAPAAVADLPSPTPIASLSASWLGSCGLLASGALACWSENAPRRDEPGPVLMTQLGESSATTASNTHACAVRHGELFCWAAARGAAELGAPYGEVTRLPVPRPVRQVQAGEGITCWVDDWGEAWCRDASSQPQRLLKDVAQLSVGAQSCARRADATVTCWGLPLPTAARAGDLLVNLSAVLAWGGGIKRLAGEGSAASELALRGELTIGTADKKHQLTTAIGPILEIRTLDLHTREAALGLIAGTAPWGAGNPAFSLGVLGGYAARADHSETVAAVLARLGLREPIDDRAGGRAHYATQLALYLASHYGLSTHAFELTTGIEVDLAFPSYVARSGR